MATAASLLIACGLSIIPYNYGSHRWTSEWTRTLRGVSLMMLVLFLPWFVLSVGIGASRALVPVVMILFCDAYGVGRWQVARRRQRRN